MTENAIEFYTEDETATLSLYRKRFINRIRKLKEQRPDEVDIVENTDGSIFAHIPVSWIKIKVAQPSCQRSSVSNSEEYQ